MRPGRCSTGSPTRGAPPTRPGNRRHAACHQAAPSRRVLHGRGRNHGARPGAQAAHRTPVAVSAAARPVVPQRARDALDGDRSRRFSSSPAPGCSACSLRRSGGARPRRRGGRDRRQRPLAVRRPRRLVPRARLGRRAVRRRRPVARRVSRPRGASRRAALARPGLALVRADVRAAPWRRFAPSRSSGVAYSCLAVSIAGLPSRRWRSPRRGRRRAGWRSRRRSSRCRFPPSARRCSPDDVLDRDIAGPFRSGPVGRDAVPAVEGDNVVRERQVRRRAATVAPKDDPVEQGADDRVLGHDHPVARRIDLHVRAVRRTRDPAIHDHMPVPLHVHVVIEMRRPPPPLSWMLQPMIWIELVDASLKNPGAPNQ